MLDIQGASCKRIGLSLLQLEKLFYSCIYHFGQKKKYIYTAKRIKIHIRTPCKHKCIKADTYIYKQAFVHTHTHRNTVTYIHKDTPR